MTYKSGSVDRIVVLESKQGMGDCNGDYARLRGPDDPAELGGEVESLCGEKSRWCSLSWWTKLVVLCLCLLAAVVAFIIWGGPFLISKVVVPILDWETTTFSTPVLGLLLFSCIAVFPSLLLPSAPCMWIAGMTFGYGYGFLLIMAGMSIGMSLPFFIGSLFHLRIHKWLKRWPKKAAIVRLAGEGDWFHQFRAVTLLRISPFPYIIFNYAAVATNVRFCPYLCGSLIGTIPETFLTIYSGRLIRSLADATNKGAFLSVQQLLYDALGLGSAMAATIAVTVYAKRTLQTLQAEEELN